MFCIWQFQYINSTKGIKELDLLIANCSPDSAFHILPTIPQTFPHFWIPHFTFRIPQFRILPMTDQRRRTPQDTIPDMCRYVSSCYAEVFSKWKDKTHRVLLFCHRTYVGVQLWLPTGENNENDQNHRLVFLTFCGIITDRWKLRNKLKSSIGDFNSLWKITDRWNYLAIQKSPISENK